MKLAFRTEIKAEIRTENDKPIQYKYSLSSNNFDNKEIVNNRFKVCISSDINGRKRHRT